MIKPVVGSFYTTIKINKTQYKYKNINEQRLKINQHINNHELHPISNSNLERRRIKNDGINED